jgi:hypothetical protein
MGTSHVITQQTCTLRPAVVSLGSLGGRPGLSSRLTMSRKREPRRRLRNIFGPNLVSLGCQCSVAGHGRNRQAPSHQLLSIALGGDRVYCAGLAPAKRSEVGVHRSLQGWGHHHA